MICSGVIVLFPSNSILAIVPSGNFSSCARTGCGKTVRMRSIVMQASRVVLKAVRRLTARLPPVARVGKARPPRTAVRRKGAPASSAALEPGIVLFRPAGTIPGAGEIGRSSRVMSDRS